MGKNLLVAKSPTKLSGATGKSAVAKLRENWDVRYAEKALKNRVEKTSTANIAANDSLRPDVLASFRSGKYAAKTTTKPITLYRVWGGKVGALGGYWTRTPPRGIASIGDRQRAKSKVGKYRDERFKDSRSCWNKDL